MKVKKVVLQNFKGFTSVEASFDENVTYLVGKNGTGKSTIGVDSIWAAMQGIAEKPANREIKPIIGDRFLFLNDKEKPANIILYLRDEKLKVDITVKRKITEGETKVSFEGPETIKLDQGWLNDLFNAFLISPRKFIALTPKEQALELGIDLSEIDAKIKAKKEDLRVKNAQVKAFGTLVQVEEVQHIDINDLLKKRGDIVEFNGLQIERKNLIDKANTTMAELKRQKESLEEQLKTIESRISAGEELIKKATKPELHKSLVEIDRDLEGAQVNNDKAGAYTTYLQKKKDKEALESEALVLEEDKTSLLKQRTEKIKEMKLPLAELSINEEGELMFNDRFIKREYFSDGELIMMVPIILSMKQSDFKYIYVQDFNLLDEDNQAKIIKFLTGKGYQLVIEYVGKPQPGQDNVIELKNFKVVNNEPVQE